MNYMMDFIEYFFSMLTVVYTMVLMFVLVTHVPDHTYDLKCDQYFSKHVCSN